MSVTWRAARARLVGAGVTSGMAELPEVMVTVVVLGNGYKCLGYGGMVWCVSLRSSWCDGDVLEAGAVGGFGG